MRLQSPTGADTGTDNSNVLRCRGKEVFESRRNGRIFCCKCRKTGEKRNQQRQISELTGESKFTGQWTVYVTVCWRCDLRDG